MSNWNSPRHSDSNPNNPWRNLSIEMKHGGSQAGGTEMYVGVKCATTTNQGTPSGLTAQDGVSISAGMKVLVWKQTDTTTNGIYLVTASGAWAKLYAFDSSKSAITGPNVGMTIAIAGGTLYGATFVLYNGGSSFVQMSGAFN